MVLIFYFFLLLFLVYSTILAILMLIKFNDTKISTKLIRCFVEENDHGPV